MMTKNLLLLALLFPFLPAATADVPLVPKPNTEVVAFGLQVIRTKAVQEVPITALDVLAGQRQLSSFSALDQGYVRDQFQKYEAAPPRSSEETVLHSAARSALLPHDPYAQELQNPSVTFVLHPYLEIIPDALSLQGKKNAIVAYGQTVNANSLRFAEFLHNLPPQQKTRLFHSSSLTISDLSLNQRLFVSNLWQASWRPECVRLCAVPDTQVTVGFYLEAVVEQSSQNGSVTYHLQLPQPTSGRDFFGFNSTEGQQGWARF